MTSSSATPLRFYGSIFKEALYVRIRSSCCLTLPVWRVHNLSIAGVKVSAPQVIGSLPHPKEFVAPVYNQVHQEQIVAEETTQNIVEISTLQVIVLEIPEVQFVVRIQEQSVEITKITKEDPQERVQQHTVEQIGPVPQTQEQIAEVVMVIPQEQLSWCSSSEILSQTRVPLRLDRVLPFFGCALCGMVHCVSCHTRKKSKGHSSNNTGVHKKN